MRPHVPVDLSLFLFYFYFRFFSKKSQSQQKLAKKITHFTIQFRPKNLRNVSANMFLFGVRKNICTAPFLDAQELHSWRILKANVCMFLYIFVRKILFHRHTSIYRHTSILKTLKFSRKRGLQGKDFGKISHKWLSLNIK